MSYKTIILWRIVSFLILIVFSPLELLVALFRILSTHFRCEVIRIQEQDLHKRLNNWGIALILDFHNRLIAGKS